MLRYTGFGLENVWLTEGIATSHGKWWTVPDLRGLAKALMAVLLAKPCLTEAEAQFLVSQLTARGVNVATVLTLVEIESVQGHKQACVPEDKHPALRRLLIETTGLAPVEMLSEEVPLVFKRVAGAWQRDQEAAPPAVEPLAPATVTEPAPAEGDPMSPQALLPDAPVPMA